MRFCSTLPFAAVAAAVQVSVPSAVPSGSSPSVEKAFLGLGIETWSFPNYTGSSTKPNNFSLNLFKALTSRNPGLPIRVGGDAGDPAQYFPSQTNPVQFGPSPTSTDAPGNGFDPSRIGPSFFDGFKLVENAKWVFQVPMLANNLSNAITYMQAAIKAMPNGSFQALEMGNEPSQYDERQEPKEFGTWGPQAYVNMWLNWTSALTSQVTGLPENAANFWALSLVGLNSWSVPGAFTDGLSNATKAIQAVSEHFYEKDSQAGPIILSEYYMNHTRIVADTSPAVSTLNFLNSQSPAIPLVLGEVGPGGCKSPCNYTVSSSFGTALWAIDFSLHTMVLGIQRVNFHQVDGSVEASWHPVEIKVNGTVTQPTVQGLFYGQVFLAELLGQLKGEIRVAELSVSPSNSSVVAYGVYGGGNISKVVLINQNVWLTNSTGDRPVASVTIGGLGSTKSVRVDRLSASAADSQSSNITWAGQQWTYANNGVPNTQRTNDTAAVSNGGVTVSTEASQAILLSVL